MGWTDLFKSKAAKLNPDPRIRWFGKLPTYPDYYTSKADEAWVVEFNDWVLKGYERYFGRRSARAEETEPGARPHGRRLEPSSCAIRMPESGMTVLATVQDFGGDMRGRPFPLCLYVGVPTAQWPGPRSGGVLPAMRVVRDLSALRQEIVRFFNAPGRFESIFEERQVDVQGVDQQTCDESWQAAASALALGDWFVETSCGLDGADLSGWTAAIDKSGRNLATLEADDFEATLCFPLSAGFAWDMQTAGWIRWLESHLDLGRRYLSLMVTGDPDAGPGRLVVVARKEISQDDFLLLTPVWRTLKHVDDLTGAGAELPSDGPAPGSRASSNWGDFVGSNAPIT